MDESPTLSPKRARWFKAMAILLPLLLLILLEVVLRLSGYGQNYALFVPSESMPAYYVMNPHVSEKYFNSNQNATIGYQEPFLIKKTDHTFRIFVLGASTAVGYPYLHNASFHRWLQYRLNRTFPDRNIEVINLALTAVNSYTIRDFALQLGDFQADAVLIYAGHNEYYGAMGVGSTSALGNSPWLVRLALDIREYRVVQLLKNIFGVFKKPLSREDLQENLMKRMTAEQEIPYQSGVYQRGIEQYQVNMEDVLSFLDEQHIPTFIGTLASNEKGLAPFISDSTQIEKSADHFYQLGQQAYEGSDFVQAKQHFIRAKELDMLRFRAPEAINEIIRALADRFTQVHLVDTQARIASYSPHGIVGNEVLLEHVHPNLRGYALLADAFYQRLKEEKMIASEWSDQMNWETSLREMPMTEVDSLKGAYEIMMLKEGWPFYEPINQLDTSNRSLPEAIAGALAVKQMSWEAAMDKLFSHYVKEKKYSDAMKVAGALALEYPYTPKFFQQTGKLSMSLEQHGRAVYYFQKAFALKPDFETAQNLFVTLLKMDRPNEALPYLNYAASVQAKFNELKTFVSQIITLKENYVRDTTNVSTINQIAVAYLRFANTEAATKYISRALEMDSDNQETLKLKEQLEHKTVN